MTRIPFPALASCLASCLALGLGGCTHLGTNIAGSFSCRAPAGDCQPVSVIDARAVRELTKTDGATLPEIRQRVGALAAGHVRTGERTLRVVLPAHVDASGTLHDEAVAWAVIEAPRWSGELRLPASTNKAGFDALRDALRNALRDAARLSRDAARRSRDTGATANPKPVSPEDSAPIVTPSPFVPASALALPSPGAEADTGPRSPDGAGPGAEGSVLPPPSQDRTPRPLPGTHIWPGAKAIEAAIEAARSKAGAGKPPATKLDLDAAPHAKDPR